jgi:hypothetical protein
LYGLGFVFGFAAALTGQIDLTARWLLLAYGLIGLLIVVNLTFERWTRRVEKASIEQDAAARLGEIVKSRTALYAVSSMIVLTVLIVFVMVTKPSLG